MERKTKLFKLYFRSIAFYTRQPNAKERGTEEKDEMEKLVEHQSMAGKSLEHNNSIELCFTATYSMENKLFSLRDWWRRWKSFETPRGGF
jgi:hypothetical protein